MKLAVILFSAWVGTAFAASAQEPNQMSPLPQDLAREAETVTKQVLEAKADTRKSLLEQMNEVCGRLEGPGRSVARGEAAVKVPPTHPEWVKYRSTAYEDALLDAQENFITERGLKIVSGKARDFFKAAHPNDQPPEYESEVAKPGGAEQLTGKLVALATAAVDGELRKLGIDPGVYEQAPLPQRHKMMSQALTRETFREAHGSLIGMIPMKSFEDSDGKGNFKVGVCAVTSQKLKDLAVEVLTSRGNMAPDPAKATDLKALYKDKEQLYHEFGIRRITDQEGYPALISFYQWSDSYTGTDPAVQSISRKEAFRGAVRYADGQLADFLNASGSFTDRGKFASRVEQALLRHPDGHIGEPEPLKQLVNAVNTSMRTDASVEITGLRTLYEWEGTHPETGKPIVGVIRIWSAGHERTIRAMEDKRQDNKLAPVTGRNGKAGTSESRDVMRADDF
jgi:hypothetical protein